MSNPIERFIQRNTRTSHKRWESMVMYALHYALRDVKIISQYSVNNYLIDGYIPDLKLAIEIDEPHHDRTAEQDAIREDEIIAELGCEFFRINVVKDSVYGQIDELVKKIRSLNPPKWTIEEKASSMQTGLYSKDNYEKLLDSGAFDYIDGIKSQAEQIGVCVDHGYNEPNTPPSNGMVGFTSCFGSLKLTVYVRATQKIRILISGFQNSEAGLNDLKLACERLGIEHLETKNAQSNTPYWRVAGFDRYLTEDETLSLLTNLTHRFNKKS